MATRMGSPRTVTWSCPQLHAASRSGMWITFRARPQLDWHPFESTVFVPQDARRELPQIVAEIRQAPLSRPGEASRAAILCASLTSTPAGRCASKATLLCHGCKKASIKAAMAAIDRNCSLNVELHDAGAGESLARQGTGRAPNRCSQSLPRHGRGQRFNPSSAHHPQKSSKHWKCWRFRPRRHRDFGQPYSARKGERKSNPENRLVRNPCGDVRRVRTVFMARRGRQASTMRTERVLDLHSGPLAGLLERPPKPIDKPAKMTTPS
jgi:hypothetical protein